MERDEAKAILELCRPGDADDLRDPMIAEAFRLLDSDAALKAWFDEQQHTDAQIAESYHQLEPPAGLKAGILAGMRAHSLATESALDPAPTPLPTTSGSPAQGWWRKPWISAAAVFALLFLVLAVPRSGEETRPASADAQVLEANIPAMVQFLAGEIDAVCSHQRSFAKQSSRPAALQAYLASAGLPSPSVLPAPVHGTPSLGCFTFDFDGAKMSMICFQRDRLIHLTTVCLQDCKGLFTEEPAVYEIRDQAFRVWVEDAQVQILSVHGTKETLPEFI